MPTADGSVNVQTEIESELNAEDAIKALNELQDKVEGLLEFFEEIGDSDFSKKLTEKLDTLKNSYQEFSNNVSNLENDLNTTVATEELKKLELEFEETRQRADDLGAALREYKNTHPVFDSNDIEALEQHRQKTKEFTDQINEASDAAEELKNKISDLKESGEGYLPLSETDEFKSKLSDTETEANEVRRLVSDFMMAFEDEAASVEASDDLINKFIGIRDILSTASPKMRQFFNILSKGISTVGLTTAAMSLYGAALNKLNKFIAGTEEFAAKLFDKFIKIGPSSVNILTSAFLRLGQSIRNVFASLTGISGISSIFSKLQSAVYGGLQAMTLYNGAAASTVNAVAQLKASLATLRNAWAAAFAPVLEAIMPILQKLISMLITAANAVGAFLAALTGKKMTVVAKNVSATAAGIGGTGKAAKKTGDNLKNVADNAKRAVDRLAGFDDLDVLGKDDDTKLDGIVDDLEDLGGAGGSGGGAGSGFDILWEDMDIPEWAKKLADMVKEMWKDADFTELGKMFAEWLTGALNSIPWDTIQEIVYKIGKSIATFLNGVFSDLALARAIGNTIAQMINTALGLAWGFVQNFNFYQFGYWIGTSLRTALESINWNMLSDILINGVNGIFESLRGFVDSMGQEDEEGNTGWTNLANNIRNQIGRALAEIKWEDIEATLIELINNLVDVIIQICESDELNDLVGKISNIVQNLPWDRIGQAAALVLTQKENIDKIKDAFINTFKNSIVLARLEGAGVYKSEIDTQGQEWANEYENAIGKRKGEIADEFKDVTQEAVETGSKEGIESANIEDGTGLLVDKYQTQAFNAKTRSAENAKTIGKELGNDTLRAVGDADTTEGSDKLANTAVNNLNIAMANQDYTSSAQAIATGLENATIGADMSGVATSLMTSIDTSIQTLMPQFMDTLLINLDTSITTMMTTLGTTIVNNYNTLIVTPLDTAIKASWQKFLLWWTTTMLNWWNLSVVPWFKQDKWKAEFNNIYLAAEDVFKTVEETITTHINNAKTAVVTACEEMVAAIQSVISALNELNSASSFGGMVGGALGLVGRAANYVSGWDIPGLASGAVIPPNSEFLAVLGDQRRGTNIEAPLDTIVAAFQDVVGNMQVENTGYSQMELDGEVFARLITPYVISELDRRGYKVDVLEA